jgi:hypothetical protein
LITMGDATEFALRSFELPLRSALNGVSPLLSHKGAIQAKTRGAQA